MTFSKCKQTNFRNGLNKQYADRYKKVDTSIIPRVSTRGQGTCMSLRLQGHSDLGSKNVEQDAEAEGCQDVGPSSLRILNLVGGIDVSLRTLNLSEETFSLCIFACNLTAHSALIAASTCNNTSYRTPAARDNQITALRKE